MNPIDRIPPVVGGLGKKVEKPAPAPPEWQPVPGSPHIQRNAQGQLRTKLPGP